MSPPSVQRAQTMPTSRTVILKFFVSQPTSIVSWCMQPADAVRTDAAQLARPRYNEDIS